VEPLADFIDNNASIALYIDEKGKVVALEDVRGVKREMIKPLPITEEPHAHDPSRVVIQVRSADYFFRCCLITPDRCIACAEIGFIDLFKEVFALIKQMMRRR
jgi:hypothetical protein